MDEVLAYLNNWFEVEEATGEFVVSDGKIALPKEPIEGQWVRVQGSILNDGVHQFPFSDLKDETFVGRIAYLAVPPALVELVGEIADWQAKNAETPYQSESFGGYSYTKASGADGKPLTWQGVFAKRLSRWKRLPCL